MLAKGHHEPAQDHWNEHQHRAQGEEQAVGPGRNDVLFEEELQAVGEGLKDAQGTRVFGADALLNRGRDLPLQPDVDQHAHHGGDQHHQHRQRQPEQVGHPRRQAEALQHVGEAGLEVESGTHDSGIGDHHGWSLDGGNLGRRSP